MTNAELVALLREARDFMRQAAISRGPCPDCTECDRRDAIIAKADAALAAQDTAASDDAFRRGAEAMRREAQYFCIALGLSAPVESRVFDWLGSIPVPPDRA